METMLKGKPLKSALHGMVIQRIPQIMRDLGNTYVFSFGRNPVYASVVDADLINPETVRYMIRYRMCSHRTGLTRMTGTVYHSEKF